jgi:outer membrane protein TolC
MSERPWSAAGGPWCAKARREVGATARRYSSAFGVHLPLAPPAPSRACRNSRRIAATAIVAVAVLIAGGSTWAAETVRLDARATAARLVEVSHLAAAADARREAVGETVKAADAAALPFLVAAATVARRSSVPEFTLPFAPPGQPPLVLFPDLTSTYATSVRGQQAIYSGGAISGQREAARHDREAAGATRSQTIADLRLTARLAYWEAVRASATAAVARAQQNRAKRLLDDTQALLAAGMAVRADMLAARERVASAAVHVIAADAAVENARAQLRSLLHFDEATDLVLADSLAGPLPPPPAAAEELQAAALTARPELAESSARLAALRSRERLARAEARPTVGAVAEWDYSRPNQRYFPQADEWKASWTVGLVASWTLFDGGKARADGAASRFTQRAASEDREELERRIIVEVANDRRNLESALSAVTAADAARAAALEREKDARERHAAGVGPMVEILDAEAELADAERQQVDARVSSWVAEAILARAVGR